mmetsp:Transcript_66474/g.111150  ORF Transcript_66474/g.111150 Transcript_66474/m.111150 type:complete len:297 (-) Transcript_66474:330-1220(-)
MLVCQHCGGGNGDHFTQGAGRGVWLKLASRGLSRRTRIPAPLLPFHAEMPGHKPVGLGLPRRPGRTIDARELHHGTHRAVWEGLGPLPQQMRHDPFGAGAVAHEEQSVARMPGIGEDAINGDPAAMRSDLAEPVDDPLLLAGVHLRDRVVQLSNRMELPIRPRAVLLGLALQVPDDGALVVPVLHRTDRLVLEVDPRAEPSEIVRTEEVRRLGVAQGRGLFAQPFLRVHRAHLQPQLLRDDLGGLHAPDQRRRDDAGDPAVLQRGRELPGLRLAHLRQRRVVRARRVAQPRLPFGL